VKFFEGLMDRITDPAEQAQIIHAANMFYRLYGGIFHGLDAEHGIPRSSASQPGQEQQGAPQHAAA
jgi:hypothetical protein